LCHEDRRGAVKELLEVGQGAESVATERALVAFYSGSAATAATVEAIAGVAGFRYVLLGEAPSIGEECRVPGRGDRIHVVHIGQVVLAVGTGTNVPVHSEVQPAVKEATGAQYVWHEQIGLLPTHFFEYISHQKGEFLWGRGDMEVAITSSFATRHDLNVHTNVTTLAEKQVVSDKRTIESPDEVFQAEHGIPVAYRMEYIYSREHLRNCRIIAMDQFCLDYHL